MRTRHLVKVRKMMEKGVSRELTMGIVDNYVGFAGLVLDNPNALEIILEYFRAFY